MKIFSFFILMYGFLFEAVQGIKMLYEGMISLWIIDFDLSSTLLEPIDEEEVVLDVFDDVVHLCQGFGVDESCLGVLEKV
jgi:hypothetical protein